MKGSKFSIDDRLHLPTAPGIYKFFNQNGELIYVGKAKNIRKRVASYFTKVSDVNRKTKRLVSEISNIEVAVVSSEFDALLLENNLIKANQPKYNILLKDDKTFPYICILNERFPRIISTRKYNPDKGQYFGPYSSVVAMKSVLDLIRKLYTIRTCKYNLSESNIKAGKFKVCLEYHIGNCLGPCEGLQNEEEYNLDIDQARSILKGDISQVSHFYKEQMAIASQELEFERAQKFKERLDLLDKFQIKSTVVNPKLSDLDIFTLVSENDLVIVNFMQIKRGAITLTKTVESKRKLQESDEDMLGIIAFDLRIQNDSQHKTILSNLSFEIGENIEVIQPKIGDKFKLVSLSKRNALEYKKNKLLAALKPDKKNEVLLQLQEDLKLSELPDHIECFDNSNLQGTNPVASMVCFKKGKPSKKDYRHYNIKTVDGPDDFASMKEIVFRRYNHLITDNLPLPKLIVVDGGKGQLSSACEALYQLDIYGKIPIVGIAKRLEEIYFPDDSIPVHINKKSPSLMLLQRIRDEAHRFAITFHRKKRSNSSFSYEMEEIPGIGPATVDILLKNFKSMKKIREGDFKEISALVGVSKASKIADYFNKKGD